MRRVSAPVPACTGCRMKPADVQEELASGLGLSQDRGSLMCLASVCVTAAGREQGHVLARTRPAAKTLR